MYHYAVTASPATAVSHARSGAFTDKDDLNLVVAKGSRFVVYTWAGNPSSDGNKNEPLLVETLEVPINGHIVFLDLVRLGDHATKHSLVILTDRLQCLVLTCDNGPDGLVIRVVAKADLNDAPSRPVDRPLVAVDPEGRCVAVFASDSVVKVIQFNKQDGKMLPPVTVRIDEFDVLDMCFVAGRPRPTLALLYIDAHDIRNIKSYEFDFARPLPLLNGTEYVLPHVEDGASMLQPLSHGGILVFGESLVMNFDGQRFSSYLFDNLKIVRAAAKIDRDRWLFGDQHGDLFLLGVRAASASGVAELHAQKLGTTSSASALVYLSAGYLYVGSAFADSQLVHLRESTATGKRESDANLVEVVTVFPNLGPITDLSVVGLQQAAQQQQVVGAKSGTLEIPEGQGQIITCSGAFQDGTLRVVRSGIGIEGELEAALPGGGIKNMWALKHPAKMSASTDSAAAAFDDFLVCSEAGSGATILGVAPGADMEVDTHPDGAAGEPELAQAEIEGFDLDARTLNCVTAKIDDTGVIIQITPELVVLCSGSNLERVHEWKSKSKIQAASANVAGQIVLACGSELLYMRVASSNGSLSIQLLGSLTFPHEIACVDATSMAREDQLFALAEFCAVGLWTDKTLRLVALTADASVSGQLHELCCVDLGEELHARSVLLQSFSAHAHGSFRSVDTVFVGMGDGHVIAYEVSDTVVEERAAKKLENRRKVSLGTQPVTLVSFLRRTADSLANTDVVRRYVFVCGDRPTVIHSDANGRLLFSNVNTKSVQSVCAFVTEEFGNCIALAQENEELDDEVPEDDEGVGSLITIGRIDNIQKLHKQTVAKLGEGPRRLSHDPATNTFCVVTVAVETDPRSFVEDAASVDNDYVFVNERSVSNVLMIDGATFETLGSTRLRPFEIGSSSTLLTLTRVGADGSVLQSRRVFAVGTAVELDEEAEPSEGRVLLYSPTRKDFLRTDVSSEGLPGLSSYAAGGAVYSIAQLSSRPNTFVCAVNSLIKVCEVVFKGDSMDDVEIVDLCTHYGALVCLSVKTHGEFIVVGDMMRSVSLLRFSSVENDAGKVEHLVEEIGRDYYPNWMTAVAILDEDTYLGAENSCNLFVVHRNSGSSNEEEASRLDTIGRFHLGEFVNVFCRGSLVMPTPVGMDDEEASSKDGAEATELDPGTGRRRLTEWTSAPIERNSTVVWGSVSGAVGLVCRLAPPAFVFLQEVEAAMQQIVQPFGLKHEEWRSFSSERLVAPAVGFIDGDLVEKYLALGASDQRKVAELVRCDPEALSRRIDVIQRALH